MKDNKLVHCAFFLMVLIGGCKSPESNLNDIQTTQTAVSERATKVAIVQTISALETLEMKLTPGLTTATITSTLLTPLPTITTQTITPSPICITPYCAAPDFSLRTLEGETISLEGLRGKVVILNFWASWCGPCEEETPLLQGLYDKYKDEGLVVLGVNQDESIEAIRKFVDIYNLTFPILIDPGEKVSDDLYDVFSIPRTFFIDRNGVIRDFERGSITSVIAEAKAKELIAGNLWATPTPIIDSILTIRNNSDNKICYIYVSLSSDNGWGDDRLGDEVLEPDHSVNIELSSGIYDIRLEDCNGNELKTANKIDISGSYLFEYIGE